MKHVAFLVLPLIAAACPVSASDLLDVSLSLQGGYRTDDLDWSIGTEEDGSKLSELSYNDVRIYQIDAGFSAKISDGVFAGLFTDFDIDWGKVDSGDSDDKDWQNFQDRAQLTNYSFSDVEGDDILDYKLTIGYELEIGQSGFVVMPLLGYAYNEQNLDIGGGAETLRALADEDGNYSHSEEVHNPIPGDAASYDTEWKGPWIGLRMRYTLNNNAFSFQAQYHDYDYDAVGDWKLSNEVRHPKSFIHEADGTGYQLSAGYTRSITPNWSFLASLNYSEFESDSGKETNYNADGTVLVQKFLGANWESSSITIGVAYSF